ncbi:MAG: FAD-dependent oxidoreductase [Bacteroidetes bacterium]|nr:FAD-dependent oxidoreductase [Bacteroidota bacterium]
MDRSKSTYEQIGNFFTDNPPAGIKDIFKRDLIIRYPHFLTSKLRKTLHQYNHTALGDKKIVQIFDRFGTYNGSNPFKMSALYSMIPHLEQNKGTFFPTGGMRAIVDSLYNLAVEQGVKFKFNQTINSISEMENRSFVIKSGMESFVVDKVVCAIDHLPFYEYILKDVQLLAKYRKQERSSSALVFYWAVDKVIPEFGLHNIFFSENYREEFEAIFKTKNFSISPTIYIHISSVINHEDAPENCQNWFVMFNTPAGISPTTKQIIELRELVFKQMDLHFKIDLNEHILFEKTWDAKGIEADTGSEQGALYGASSNGKLAALRRHGNKSKKYQNLYFCGGTVHPGGGIPLVLKSAKIVSHLMTNER